MKVYGDFEGVNLATGVRYRRVSGDGESRLIAYGELGELLEPVMDAITLDAVRRKFVAQYYSNTERERHGE